MNSGQHPTKPETGKGVAVEEERNRGTEVLLKNYKPAPDLERQTFSLVRSYRRWTTVVSG
jgi:hypothetical protein